MIEEGQQPIFILETMTVVVSEPRRQEKFSQTAGFITT